MDDDLSGIELEIRSFEWHGQISETEAANLQNLIKMLRDSRKEIEWLKGELNNERDAYASLRSMMESVARGDSP